MTTIARVLVCVLLTTATAAVAEEVRSYDHRVMTTDAGLYALFCSRPEAEGSEAGDAFVALAEGASVDALKVTGAFGLTKRDGEAAVGNVDEEYVAAVRASDTTKTFAVRLDEEQFGIAKALVDEWSKRSDFEDEPDVVTLNFCETLVLRQKMKKPSRPVLSRANPHVYFADLAALNRDRVEKKAP